MRVITMQEEQTLTKPQEILVMMQKMCYDWKDMKPFLDAMGKLFKPKYPQKNDTRLYSMLDKYNFPFSLFPLFSVRLPLINIHLLVY